MHKCVNMIVALSALLLLAGGCAAPKQTFQLELLNATNRPISIGLVKNGPPVEEGWTSPSEIAINAPQLTDRRWGMLIEPGQTAVIGPKTGRFPSGTLAILRAYAGNPTIEELLAYGRDDPDRLDIYLWPGSSSYVIDTLDGRLKATNVQDVRAYRRP